MESWFYNLINPILRLVVTVLMKWEVTGIEHIPMQGPLIVVANHISFLDGVFLAMAIPRQVHLFMKVEGLNIPILGGFLGLWGAFPVRRGVVDRLALRKALDVLDEDKVLGVFPEGTRGGGDTSHLLLRAKPGVTVIALRSSAPLLPVGIIGTGNPFSRGSDWLRLRRPRVQIRIGEPFQLLDYEGQFDRQVLFSATSDIMYHIADLLPPDYHGYYADRDQPLPEDVKGRGKIRHLIKDSLSMTA